MKYEIIETVVFFGTDGFDLHWRAKNWAAQKDSPMYEVPVFGILSFKQTKEGFAKAHTESMSEEFCQAVLYHFLQSSLRENES